MDARNTPVWAILFLFVPLAGCAAPGDGTIQFFLSDQPNAIGDFRHLNVTITKVRLHAAEKDNASWEEFIPRQTRWDLTTLVGTNETELVGGGVDAGKYTFVELEVADAVGQLKSDGRSVAVEVPSGRLFLNHPFDVGEGKVVEFVFDVTVVKTGSGLLDDPKYQLKPNAGDSGPR